MNIIKLQIKSACFGILKVWFTKSKILENSFTAGYREKNFCKVKIALSSDLLRTTNKKVLASGL